MSIKHAFQGGTPVLSVGWDIGTGVSMSTIVSLQTRAKIIGLFGEYCQITGRLSYIHRELTGIVPDE